MKHLGALASSASRHTRGLLRRAAVRFGGLPHSSDGVDSPPPAVAHDITHLWMRSFHSTSQVVDAAADEVVTMTTHGRRLRTVWLAIESIGRGTVLPGRIILWLDAGEQRLPWRLRRLQKRGLEVKFVAPGFGVHTKYWHYLATQDLNRPLVLSDDDIVYPPTWLEALRRELIASHGRSVIAYRAHSIGMSSPDEFTPYASWDECRSAEPSYHHFATSVSGQILPPELQTAIRKWGTSFLTLAPTADDVWIHRCGVMARIPTKQITAHQQHWWFIPGSQATGLNAMNVAGGANDVQISASHNDETRARIWRSIELEDGLPGTPEETAPSI